MLKGQLSCEAAFGALSVAAERTTFSMAKSGQDEGCVDILVPFCLFPASNHTEPLFFKQERQGKDNADVC